MAWINRTINENSVQCTSTLNGVEHSTRHYFQIICQIELDESIETRVADSNTLKSRCFQIYIFLMMRNLTNARPYAELNDPTHQIHILGNPRKWVQNQTQDVWIYCSSQGPLVYTMICQVTFKMNMLFLSQTTLKKPIGMLLVSQTRCNFWLSMNHIQTSKGLC